MFAKFLRTRGKTRQGCSLSRHFLDIPAYICLGGGSITRRGPFEFPKGNSRLVNGYGELFKADARDSAVPAFDKDQSHFVGSSCARVKLADIFPTGVTLPSRAVSLEKGERGDYSLISSLFTFVPLPRNIAGTGLCSIYFYRSLFRFEHYIYLWTINKICE